MSITRQWTDNIGPDNKRKHDRGVPGTDEETLRLVQKGFHRAESVNGDCYYYNPDRSLIWLFPDRTWFGEKTPQGGTLEDYLNSIPDTELEEMTFQVVQIEAGLPNDLGQMTGAELLPYVMNRVESDIGNAAFAELAQKGAVNLPYTEQFGVGGSFEIRRIVRLPKAGDTFYYPNGNRGTIHMVSEGMVDISADRSVTPTQLQHFAPHPNGDPNTWILVGLDHS